VTRSKRSEERELRDSYCLRRAGLFRRMAVIGYCREDSVFDASLIRFYTNLTLLLLEGRKIRALHLSSHYKLD